MPLSAVTLDALTIEDESAMASIEVYPRLKQVLQRAGHRFYVPANGETASWDRTVFLNLTYWGGPESGDVLCDASIPADVVAHTAWHHLATEAVSGEVRPGARAMLFGESIASAFDLYLLGHLLEKAPQSDFVVSQTPIMAEVAENAGVSARDFSALMDGVSREPERAFEDLRALLFDASTALVEARSAPAAEEVLDRFAGHRFFPLLHHYQLSNWVLYARAYAGDPGGDEARKVEQIDQALRAAPASLSWLAQNWL
jgi:hypothetical protein